MPLAMVSSCSANPFLSLFALSLHHVWTSKQSVDMLLTTFFSFYVLSLFAAVNCRAVAQSLSVHPTHTVGLACVYVGNGMFWMDILVCGCPLWDGCVWTPCIRSLRWKSSRSGSRPVVSFRPWTLALDLGPSLLILNAHVPTFWNLFFDLRPRRHTCFFRSRWRIVAGQMLAIQRWRCARVHRLTSPSPFPIHFVHLF